MSDFQTDVVCEDPNNRQASISKVTCDLHEECPCQSTEVWNDDQSGTASLRDQLKKKHIFLISKDAGYSPCLKHSFSRNSTVLESNFLLILAIDQRGS